MADTNTERAAVARAIWEILALAEDRCDVDIEDLSPNHIVWEMADVVIAVLAAKAPAAEPGRWYAMTSDGIATLCADREDAVKMAASYSNLWPKSGPYRAVQLYTAPPAPTEQWRDIETAPQDGTRVILAEAEKVFHGGFVGVQFKEHRDADGNYLDQTDADAYWMNFEEGDVCHPTHWQPEPALPAPPQGAAKVE